METQCIENHLQDLMCKERFAHSLGVKNEAIKLADHYGADVDKAMLAGLMHDCVKDFDYNEMLRLCDEYGVELDMVTKTEKKLIHANLGAYYIKNEFGITDEDIFDAVRYHTTGKPDMPLLTKIIYIADYIEPNRTFAGVEDLRRLAYEDMDKAIFEGLNFTIGKLLSMGRMLHIDTVKARNYIILNRGANL